MVTHTPSPHKPHPTLMLFPSHEKISAGPPVSHDTPDSQRSRLSRACSRCSASCVTSSETFMPRLSETYCRPGLAYRRSSESPVQQEDPLVRVIIWRAHICFPSSETFGPRLNRPAIVLSHLKPEYRALSLAASAGTVAGGLGAHACRNQGVCGAASKLIAVTREELVAAAGALHSRLGEMSPMMSS